MKTNHDDRAKSSPAGILASALLVLGAATADAGAGNNLEFNDNFEADNSWSLFEEIVGGNSCYGAGIGQVIRSTDVARTGEYSLLVWPNAAGSLKSNHLIANRRLNATGLSGKVRFETYAYIDPASATTSQTGPEFSMQNTRQVSSGVFRTSTAGIQYVASPYASRDWQIWAEQSPGVAGWQQFHTQALTPGIWYRLALVADFDANRYIRLVIDGSDVSQELDLSAYAIAQEPKFNEAAFWITLEGENLWNNCGDAGAFSSKIYYDHVMLKQFSAPPVTPPGMLR